MKLAPFIEHPSCKKCHSTAVQIEYAKGRKGFQEYGWSTPIDIPERLICSCESCGHKWRMATAGSEDEQ